uniref:NADH-ubiquinone oxidoreductase chain 5 n=1 Tax=Cecidomyiidae sp. 3 LC-2017 TaxID=2030135 RepID=A0A343LA48_9DIPT|nr:NADH dehydrogenase subunit 5 [Cecidomyiidae sp. 3 LC-2017]
MFLFLSGLFSFWLFMYMLIFEKLMFYEWELINIQGTHMTLNFLLDWMSLLFISVVFTISSMVIFYSMDYMADDKNKVRFIMLLILFIISMMFLIISPNLISVLIGWDGLGLISYCLVIYYQNYKSYNAGMLTALSNRIGDSALLLSIGLMSMMGCWNFCFYLQYEMMSFSFYFVVLASLTKSAQVPFSAWLPAAMAAPTPVSALVHSSTLVTAGIYLLIRFNFLVHSIFNFMLLISIITLLMSSFGACFEKDMKKIIALSTLSQLGLMMSILSLGFFKLSFFHLLTHALFKSLLFLCSGIFIHNFINFQDIRYLGMLNYNILITLSYFNISSLALMGMPFLAGFYSKDMIIEYMMNSNMNVMIFWIYCLSITLTVIYSLRLMSLMINNKMSFNNFSFIENKLSMISMALLMMFSIMGGSIFNWLIFPYKMTMLFNMFYKLLVIKMSMTGILINYLFLFLWFNKIKLMKLKIYKLMYFISSMLFFNNFIALINFQILLIDIKIKLITDSKWMEYYNIIIINYYKNFYNKFMT